MQEKQFSSHIDSLCYNMYFYCTELVLDNLTKAAIKNLILSIRIPFSIRKHHKNSLSGKNNVLWESPLMIFGKKKKKGRATEVGPPLLWSVSNNSVSIKGFLDTQ